MSEVVLDRALRDLGGHLAWPTEADLTASVRAELENVRLLRPRSPGRRAALVAAVALLVLTGLLALSPGLRAAFFRLIGIRGAEVEVHETVAPPSGSPFAGQALLGDKVTLDEAEQELGFDLALPTGLGEGEGVFLLRGGASTIATVAYHDGDLIFSQFGGRVVQETITKIATVGQAERVSVDGARGIWIEGTHTVLVESPTGAIVESMPLLGGNTLLWTVEGVTFRVEGASNLSDALRIARTVAL